MSDLLKGLPTTEVSLPISIQDDWQELMSRDPLQMSKQDIEKIVVRLREQYQAHALGVKQAGNMKKPAKIAKLKVESLDPKDLGL